jgi:hypothetical protein
MSGALTGPAAARGELPLALLVNRIGAELDTLAQLSAEVQSALAMCRFVEPTRSEAIQGLQGIDRVTQSLEDLGALLHVLATRLPAALHMQTAPMLSQLRLHELQAKLHPEAHAPDPLPRPGEIQWF